MPRSFSRSTAEQVVQVVEAVHVGRTVDLGFVERFCDFSADQSANAMALAEELGLVAQAAGKYRGCSTLCRYFSTAVDTQKASALRLALQDYDLFFFFTERLRATNSADTAAQQTKAAFDLDAHREEIKDTLLSFGTYTGAIQTGSGGTYTVAAEPLENPLMELAESCESQDAAEAAIRKHVGVGDALLDRDTVILPLARALMKSVDGEAREAVADAAIGFESFLALLANEVGVSLAGASGISQKIQKFRPGGHLPKKLVEASKYVAQLRNAADHGVDVDPEVGAVWLIRPESGPQFVMVTTTLIAACISFTRDQSFTL